MPVPDYQTLMRPVLQALADAGPNTPSPLADVRARIIDAEGLTPDDLSDKLANGMSVFVNRVSWAVIYMERAGLVERVGRGVYRVADEGQRLLARGPGRIDNDVLGTYPAYARWWKRESAGSRQSGPLPPDVAAGETPDETLRRAARQMRATLEAELLARVRDEAPAFLEQAVIDLLMAMGYGGGDADMGLVTGRSGDGGIDGAIREDVLGLDEIYVQAKKYADGNTVGESDLRNFAGAIDAAGTTKGVFVTTSGFTRAAEDFVKRSPKRIRLIDGKKLASLLVQYNIGVRTSFSEEVKRIDEEYFDHETL